MNVSAIISIIYSRRVRNIYFMPLFFSRIDNAKILVLNMNNHFFLILISCIYVAILLIQFLLNNAYVKPIFNKLKSPLYGLIYFYFSQHLKLNQNSSVKNLKK